MPRVYDNIEENSRFIEAIRHAEIDAHRADFCAGYPSLRRWKAIADTLKCSLKAGIRDEQLVELVMDLRAGGQLCIVSDGSMMDGGAAEGVRIVSGLGMVQNRRGQYQWR